MIHVEDLTRRLVALLAVEPQGAVVTASDARAEGYLWEEVFTTAARAVGNSRARLVQAPAALLRVLALAGDAGRLFGAANMLSTQKLRELRHLDWSVPADGRAVPAGWQPRFSLVDGFAQTVAWYQRAGWL
jgi:nucleoside-diphosphate-sugar epimerase